ncbi:hypothetical protein [Lyngbya sp. CCY1209]|uniref:hypothetical protein n=1 Tax=Lyngbya sp. CCY1209 TaxID=2886103 RepID=UPI002D20D4D7|nr:hypothetical protein [Lyngbya sp. CCY1209]MEB3884753.1 hypothetical protein [Lyngbya sp. CCY1209]
MANIREKFFSQSPQNWGFGGQTIPSPQNWGFGGQTLKLCIRKEMVGYGADEKLWVFPKNYCRA